MSGAERLPWDEKYRPRRFAEVVGQARAVSELTAAAKSKSGLNVILSGPSGTGKSSLARVFAKAAMCLELTEAGEACNVCPSCSAWRTGWNVGFRELNSGVDGTVERIRELVSGPLDEPPMHGRVHAVVFAEAHLLSLRARDALLEPLEKMAGDCAFIFTLIDPTVLPHPLRSRCRDVQLDIPSVFHRQGLVGRIAAEEQVNVAPEAQELLARYTPNLRSLAKRLQSLSEAAESVVRPEQVRALLLRNGPGAILDYLKAAAFGHWDDQLECLRAARLPANEKVEVLQGVLLNLKLRYVGPITRPSLEIPFDGLLDETQCREIVQRLGVRAEVLGIPLLVLFDQILEFWSFWPRETSDLELELQAARFHDRLTFGEEQLGVIDTPASSRRAVQKVSMPRPVKRRARGPAKWVLPHESGKHLTVAQAKAIYDAASFLMQRHGLCFNGVLELNPAWYNGSEAAWGDFCSELCRQLGQHYSKWPTPAGDDRKQAFHRILLHENPPEIGLSSTVLFHVAPQFNERIRAQIHGLLPARAQDMLAPDGDWLRVSHSRKEAGRLALHWQLVRALWRGLDPEVTYQGRPLVDILGAPPRGRRPAGHVENHRYALSQSLSSAERTRAAAKGNPPFSVWSEQAWEFLFTGWELDEFERRRQRDVEHKTFVADLDRDIENAIDSLTRQNLIFLRAKADTARQNNMENRGFPWRPRPVV